MNQLDHIAATESHIRAAMTAAYPLTGEKAAVLRELIDGVLLVLDIMRWEEVDRLAADVEIIPEARAFLDQVRNVDYSDFLP